MAEIGDHLTTDDIVVWDIGGGSTQQPSDSLLTLDNIEKTAFSRVGWTDEQINDKYADVQIANLAPVIGAMKALNINQVWALQVNNTSGVLINPAYWTRADSKP